MIRVAVTRALNENGSGSLSTRTSVLCIGTEPRNTTKTMELLFTLHALKISIGIAIREAFARHPLLEPGLGSRLRSTSAVGLNFRGLRLRQVSTQHILFRIGIAICIMIPYFSSV